MDADRPRSRAARGDADSSWPQRPDWWPDPPDARELEAEAAARDPEATEAGDAASRPRPDRAAPARERSDEDPPTLPGLPNQWAELPPTVPEVPERPGGIRRSTILLILLWVAVLALYLWVRPVG